jgi:hypothetical protein
MKRLSGGQTGTLPRSSRSVLLLSIQFIVLTHLNWGSPSLLQVGDFGTIDKKTGELKVEGNIFTHLEIKHIAQEYPAFEAPEVDLYQIHSQQVKRLDVQADVRA